MHAKYFFLLDLPEDYDSLDPSILGEEITSEFDSVYGIEKCDENNGYAVVALILPDGRSVPICAYGDYRGRDTWAHYIARIPRNGRWAWARNFAMGCTEYELHLEWDPGKCQGYQTINDDDKNLSIEQRDKRIRKLVPGNLRTLALARINNPGDPSLEWYESSMGSGYRIYQSSEYIPFAKDIQPPYEYRNYDLRNNGARSEQCAILMVDIHT
jgi:hypothetical protein